MARPLVYVETTVISYLTARPSRDVITRGRQQATRKWWKLAADRFELFASRLVVSEASAGDQVAAADRLKALELVALLDVDAESEALAQELLDALAVPDAAAEDALHIALAAVNGANYLVTWNCRHIANAIMRPAIEDVCRACGYEPPVICTPDELMEPSDD